MSALNPRLIVEVLSPSTEAYTRGERFRRYREIPSLRQYVVVPQNEPVIETFFKQDDGVWALETFQGMDAVAQFRSVDASVAVKDVFDGVEFPSEDQQASPGKDRARSD